MESIREFFQLFDEWCRENGLRPESHLMAFANTLAGQFEVHAHTCLKRFYDSGERRHLERATKCFWLSREFNVIEYVDMVKMRSLVST